jgi:hypothetical protein
LPGSTSGLVATVARVNLGGQASGAPDEGPAQPPLPHQGCTWAELQAARDKYWDAIMFFKSVNLAQLDVKGNTIASKVDFRTLVMTLIPSLKWLDGECVH